MEEKEKKMFFDEDMQTTGDAGTSSEPQAPEGEEVPQEGEEQEQAM